MSKSAHQERVEKFMDLAGQMRHIQPTIPPASVRLLGARLILEEALETIQALGVDIELSYPGITREGIPLIMERCVFGENKYRPVSIEDIADGCADVRVVSTWVMCACGIEDEELMQEIDNNNLAKFGPGSFKESDGKLCKPPGHPKPDIFSVLQRQAERVQ